MGEVSRLLIASPGVRQMETFFLILFSSLIGIDARYSFFLYFNIIISFSIIILQMTVVVSCGHWGNHLHWYSSVHLDKSWVMYCFSGILFFYWDRMQKNPSFIVLLLVSFFVAALHHVYNSVLALHHAYCSVLSSLPWKFLLRYWYVSVLSSSPGKILLHHWYVPVISSSPQVLFLLYIPS